MNNLIAAWSQHENRIGAWASVIGLIGFFVTLMFPYSTSQTTKEAIYAAGLVALSLGAVLLHLTAVLRSGRKARHAEAMTSIRESVRNGTKRRINSGERRA